MTQTTLLLVLLAFLSTCNGVCHPASVVEEYSALGIHNNIEFFSSKYFAPEGQVIYNGNTATPQQFIEQFKPFLAFVKELKITINTIECQENWCYVDDMMSFIGEHEAGDLLGHRIFTFDDNCKIEYMVLATNNRATRDMVQRIMGGHKG